MSGQPIDLLQRRRQREAAKARERDGADTAAPSGMDASAATPTPPAEVSEADAVAYAELHCLSDFSFQRGASSASELFQREGRWYGLVSLFDVHDPAAMAALAAAQSGITFLDLKTASEQLVAAQRSHIILCLGVAALALVVVIWIALALFTYDSWRDWRAARLRAAAEPAPAI